MKVDKIAVSFDPELDDAVRKSARRAGVDLSAWLASAAAAQLRAEALAEFRDDWELGQPSRTAVVVARADVATALSRPDFSRPDAI